MRHFYYIFLFGIVIAGCSDHQAAVEEESETTLKRSKPADDLQSNSIETGVDDINADTIGMAEFLALKASVAAKYRQVNDLADESDENLDTTGFTAFKRSKAKTAGRPCDCEDSIKAVRKKDNKSRNSRSGITEGSTQDTDADDEADSTDQAQVIDESGSLPGNL